MPILDQFDNEAVFKNGLRRNIFHLAALGAGYLFSERSLGFSLYGARDFNAIEYFKEYLEDDRLKAKLAEKDIFGKTPLDYAIEAGNDKLIIYLLTFKELKNELLNKCKKVSITLEEIQQLIQYKNPDKLGQNDLNDKLELFVDGVERVYDLHTIGMKAEQWSSEDEMLNSFNKEYQEKIPLIIKLENSGNDEFYIYGLSKIGKPQINKLNLKHYKEIPFFESPKRLAAENISIEVFHEIALSQAHVLADGSGQSFIDHLGMCHGWTFLAHVYFSAGKGNKFNEIRQVLAKWQGTKEDLKGPLPDSLQKHYKDQEDLFRQYKEKSGIFEGIYKKYPEAVKFLGIHEDGKTFLAALLQKRRDSKSLEALAIEYGIEKEDLNQLFDEIFDRYRNKEVLLRQLINDLSIFHITEAVDNLKLESGLKEEERQKQYEMIKDSALGRTLQQILVTQSQSLTKAQLAEYLKLFSYWPGVSIDIGCYPPGGGDGHTIGIDMTPNGKFKYFDSNLESEIEPFETAEELADHILTSVFQKNGWIESNKARIEFWVGKFYDKGEDVPEVVPTRASIPYKSSPNEFTELHYAVYENDAKKMAHLLKANPEIILKNDVHGRHAVDIAMLFALQGNLSPLKHLMKAAESNGINIKALFLSSITSSNMRRFPLEAQKYFILEGWVGLHDRDKAPSYILFKSGWTEEKVLALITTNSEKINYKYAEGKTFLMQAFEARASLDFIQRLLAAGSNPSQTDDRGRSAIFYALEYQADPAIIKTLLAQLKNLKLEDGSGKTLLMYAFEYGAPSEILNILLKECELGATDNQGKSVLAYALEAQASDEILVDLALETNLRPKVGQTPLMKALECGASEKTILMLIQMGSDLTRADLEGKTVLMYALEHGATPAVLDILLDDKNKLDLNQKDNQGKTALMRLVTQHPLNVIGLERLLAKGPGRVFSGRLDLEIVDESRFTALQLAVKSGNELAVEMLTNARAKMPQEREYVKIAERVKSKLNSLEERIKKARNEQVGIQQEKVQRDRKHGLSGIYARDVGDPLPRKPAQSSEPPVGTPAKPVKKTPQ